MTLPNLISFSGYSRAGKDAAADLLVQRARFAKTYMAKPLEQAMVRMNPWIVDQKQGSIERYADLHENLGFDATKEFEEARRLLALGTAVGRDLLGRNVWSEIVFEEVDGLLAEGKKVALSGVEHQDEMDMVRERGGVCVWIRRFDARSLGRTVPEGFDLVVDNVGSLKDFYVGLITTLEEYTPSEETNNVG